MIAFSITRALVYVHVGQRLNEHYNDETCEFSTLGINFLSSMTICRLIRTLTDYTSPIFWATIELSTAVMSASLPTYRLIWLNLYGRGIKMNKLSYRLRSYPNDSKSYRASETRERTHKTHNNWSTWQDASSQGNARVLIDCS